MPGSEIETKNRPLCQFILNGERHIVGSDVPFDMSLNTYLRQVRNLRGTKSMCLEGGCGSCILSLTVKDPAYGKSRTMAVNSCLFPLYSCAGKSITTIEGLGSIKRGYSKEQRTLADFNGTQCGYCSPGMVMNMHSLIADKKVTMEEIENSFAGNICRCTGYRPIMTAFKTLASDATPELCNKCEEVESCCSGACCQEGDWFPQNEELLEFKKPPATWNKPKTIDQVFNILKKMPDGPYILVGGNTAYGVYKTTIKYRTYIDISNVDDLHSYSVDTHLKLGGNMTLTDAMNVFQSISKEHSATFAYTEELAKHIDLIASVSVRNTGTLAGNLSIKNQHREFPSDIFLMLETVGAKLEIGSSHGSIVTVNLPEFLDMDMNRKLIVKVKLPPLDSNSYVVRSYKIMPRAQNAHAYMNVGFCFKLNTKNKGQVLKRPRIVYGGINPEFIHAIRTEEYLNGKQLFNVNVLKAAFRILENELDPDYVLPDATPEYRKGLAVSLFYKFVLSLAPQGLKDCFASGGLLLSRALSHGKQKYQTDHELWPINKPVVKLEGHVQTSGEAAYADDLLSIPGELFASFVLAKEGPGTIAKIDASKALAEPGVVAFFGADDIPGKNNFTQFTPELFNLPEIEEVFSSGEILFAGQPVGMIVATSKLLAQSAAENLVRVIVKDRKTPVLTIEDAIASGDDSRVRVEFQDSGLKNGSAGGIIDTVSNWWAGKEQERTRTVTGKFKLNSQYHYHMETQTCICIPVEDGMNVHCSTQWIDLVNSAIAEFLGIPENSINIIVRRMGGAYGAKITRVAQVACACALAAHKLNRPVRFIMSMIENMESIGKRFPTSFKYEVSFTDEGKITSLTANLYQNSGSNWNETVLPVFAEEGLKNGYDYSNWKVTGTAVKTDQPSHTYNRSPGSFEGVIFIETVMEHIAHELGLDPLKVRLINIELGEINVPKLVEELRTSSNYDQRKKDVEAFNKENRWKKRGLAVAIMKFPIVYFGGYYSMVSIYHIDGSVAVCHSGGECGQGINTKVAQVAAKFLGIDYERVTIKPGNNFTAPNAMITGGSITSETCAYATMICCQELLKRLEPVRETLINPTWTELVGQAYVMGVDLNASYMSQATDYATYAVEGAAVAEVEIDVLTGQSVIQRVDILENAGKSMSPELDIGQVEGAFIMGVGCLTSEELLYDPSTGRLMNTRSWNYKPPGARDIPVEFNVELQGNNPNPHGVLRSKTTGEPGLCLSSCVLFAIRNAILEARKDAGISENYFELDTPATFEQIFLACKTHYEQFSL